MIDFPLMSAFALASLFVGTGVALWAERKSGYDVIDSVSAERD